jgi:hypothetical protein
LYKYKLGSQVIHVVVEPEQVKHPLQATHVVKDDDVVVYPELQLTWHVVP